MAWPTGVTLRTCSLGPDFGIVSGDDYGCDIVVSVSRPMMTWGATGSGGIGDQDSLSFTPGIEITFQLPVTDQVGWYIGGLPVDMSDGRQSHVYTLTIKPWIYNSLGRKTFSNATLTLANLAVPTGADTLDLDKSVATAGAQGGTVTIPDLVGQLQATVETSATDAAASASAAAASAQTAHDISNIDTSDDVVSTLVADPQTGPKTTAALNAAIALGNALPALEMVPFTDYGNSWAAGGVSSTPGAGYWSRIASRNRTGPQINQGVSGTQSNEILAKVASTWLPNTQGLVGLGDIVLNDLRHWATDTDKATTRECFRSILARLNSWSIQDNGSASLVYGPGWTAGVSDGTPGRYVDVAWTGPIVNIRVGCVTGAGATVTVKDSGTGTTVATVATGGYKVAFEGVIRLAGYDTGNHTVRVSVDAAATVAGAIMPMPSPPLIVWLKAGDTTENGIIQRDRTTLYLAECATIAADYPNVLPVDLTGHGWDMITMLAADGLHPNDSGNAFIANRIQAELIDRLAQNFEQGLNSMTDTSAGVYAPPAPAYAGPGATAPTAPTGVAAVSGNQMTVTWVRAADGGATITAQPIQVSTDGGGTWNTAATATASATTYIIATGLVEGTSYVVRVGATNSVGTTYSAASAAVTAGAAPTTYFADTFTRADGAPGNTETGGLAWATTNGTLAIASGKLTAATTNGADVDAYIDDGHANGTLKATLAASSGISTGLVFRASGATDGYVLWCQTSSTKNWILSKRTGASAYSQITILATGTGTIGDEAKVVMNGATVKVYLNGALAYTLNDTVFAANTRHALWRASQAGTNTATLPDNVEHNSLTA